MSVREVPKSCSVPKTSLQGRLRRTRDGSGANMKPKLARFENNFWEEMEAHLFSHVKLFNAFVKEEVLEIVRLA
jgi:hypothetical protein